MAKSRKVVEKSHKVVIHNHQVDLDKLITRVGCPLIIIGLLGIMVMPHDLAFFAIIIDFFFVPMVGGIILVVTCIVKEARHSKYQPMKEED